jgi:hypothetical protein
MLWYSRISITSLLSSLILRQFSNFLDWVKTIFQIVGTSKLCCLTARFDFIIVIGTDIGILMKIVNVGFDISTAATVIRGFRIMRIFRLVSMKVLFIRFVHLRT